MTTSTIPPTVADTRPGRGLVIASFVAPLAYLIWFWVMFAFGYWLTDVLGAYPTTDRTMWSLGLIGWLAAIGFALLVALPSWTGIGLAIAARGRGAGTAAIAALVLNSVMAVGFLILSLVP